MVHWLRAAESDTLITVWAVPRSSATALAGPHGNAMKVRIAAAPESGKANQAMLDFLGERLGTRVSLEAGMSQRRKIVRAHGVAPNMVEMALADPPTPNGEPSTVNG